MSRIVCYPMYWLSLPHTAPVVEVEDILTCRKRKLDRLGEYRNVEAFCWIEFELVGSVIKGRGEGELYTASWSSA